MSQAFHDLKWVLTSPSLMGPSKDWRLATNPKGTQWSAWLASIEDNPKPLEEYLSEIQGHRLGLYYELLLKFFFEHYPHFKLLMHNFPVYQQKRTIGAFDFIYQNDQNQIIHRECAVKFYLGIPESSNDTPSQWSAWWGPNKVDRLDKKLHHLMHHQILLSDTPEAKAIFESKNIKVDFKEIDLKGYLFYPLHHTMSQPSSVNLNHHKAYWLSENELDSLPARQYWDILDRMRWLSPVQVKNKPRLSTSKLRILLKSHFKHNHAPILIAQLKKNENGYIEASRYFVTPNDWKDREAKND